MRAPAQGEAPDYAELSRYLRVLSEPNRLALLRKLQFPHALADIDLQPSRPGTALSATRALSRQAVHEHLGKLRDLGLVQARSAERDGRGVTEYVVNHARLFVLLEELRRLSLIRAAREEASQATVAGRPETPADAPMPKGRALVLASGPFEGSSYPLEGAGPWLIGRDDDLAVALTYDPFVSKHNTRLALQGGTLLAHDLPGNRNGTRVNWRPLPPGGSAPLAAGDMLGVGRSLLVVRGA